MKFLQWAKDGGKESTVDGFFIVEIKKLFSIVLLKFNPGTRENYHSHAFNALTWWLKGGVVEIRRLSSGFKLQTVYKPSLKPKLTRRDNCHKVFSFGTSWAISFRGPWKDTWQEYNPKENRMITPTHGRRVVGE